MSNILNFDAREVFTDKIIENIEVARALDKLLKDIELQTSFNKINDAWKNRGELNIEISDLYNKHYEGKAFTSSEECTKFRNKIEKLVEKESGEKIKYLDKVINSNQKEFDKVFLEKAKFYGVTKTTEIKLIEHLYIIIKNEPPLPTIQNNNNPSICKNNKLEIE